jgi:hypothetical protein
MGDHRREKLFREHFVGREVVVKECDDAVADAPDIGDDLRNKVVEMDRYLLRPFFVG